MALWARVERFALRPGARAEQSELPGERVVGAPVGCRIEALKDVLKLAGVDGQRLIVARADHLAVADVVGPRSRAALEGDVGGPGEGRASGILQGNPGTIETLRGPRAEVAAVVRARIEGLDQG